MTQSKPVVWIFNHYVTDPDSAGGSRHFDWAKELIRRGYKVVIVASSFHYLKYKESREYLKSFYLNENIQGVPFIWIKTIPYFKNDFRRFINMLSFAWLVYKFPSKLLQPKPDIIIGSSVHLFTPFAAWFLAKRIGSKFILEIRDLWPETLIQLGWKKWHPFIIILGWLEKYLYKRARNIILLFPKAHEYILNLNIGINPKKLLWIPNGVNCSDFEISEVTAEMNEKISFINRGVIKIVNAGALGNVYALDKLIEAMKIVSVRNRDVILYLIGNGPMEQELKAKVASLNLTNVIFHDSIPKKHIPYVLNKADILYASLMKSPLYKYGMSLNKLYDYMAAAKPVIFAVDSVNNPVDEAGAGITVSPDSEKEIAEAILKLAEMSGEERKGLGERGRQYARMHFDTKALIDRLEPILLN